MYSFSFGFYLVIVIGCRKKIKKISNSNCGWIRILEAASDLICSPMIEHHCMSDFLVESFFIDRFLSSHFLSFFSIFVFAFLTGEEIELDEKII